MRKQPPSGGPTDLPVPLGTDGLDFGEVVASAGVHARALLANLAPGIRRAKVASPERPGPALERPDGVNRTFPHFASASEKNAVTIQLFSEAISKTAATQVFLVQPAVRSPEELGNPPDFLFADPDIAGLSGAAIATLGAAEIQSCPIPLLFCHSCTRTAAQPVRNGP